MKEIRWTEALQQKPRRISNLFLCRAIKGVTLSLERGASGHTICKMPDNILEQVFLLLNHQTKVEI
jgi:hypothetical protein